MNLNFSTNNWETIATGWKFYSLLIFFLIIVFKKPLADRLSIMLHRGYERKKERKNRIDVARNVVSQRLSNGHGMNGDLTDDNGYLAIRRHLSSEALRTIEREDLHYNGNPGVTNKYFNANELRLGTLASELDRLSKKWRLPV